MKEQTEKIDDVLLTASIAILAGSALIYTSKTESNPVFSIATLISIILLSCCILLTLYHRYRTSLRKNQFDEKIEKWFAELKSDLDHLTENFIKPQVIRAVKTTTLKNKDRLDTDPSKMKELFLAEWADWEKDQAVPRKFFAESQGAKMKLILNDAFNGPLKEKNALVKMQLEQFTTKRYAFFVLGLIAFIVSVASKLF